MVKACLPLVLIVVQIFSQFIDWFCLASSLWRRRVRFFPDGVGLVGQLCVSRGRGLAPRCRWLVIGWGCCFRWAAALVLGERFCLWPTHFNVMSPQLRKPWSTDESNITATNFATTTTMWTRTSRYLLVSLILFQKYCRECHSTICDSKEQKSSVFVSRYSCGVSAFSRALFDKQDHWCHAWSADRQPVRVWPGLVWASQWWKDAQQVIFRLANMINNY